MNVPPAVEVVKEEAEPRSSQEPSDRPPHTSAALEEDCELINRKISKIREDLD